MPIYPSAAAWRRRTVTAWLLTGCLGAALPGYASTPDSPDAPVTGSPPGASPIPADPTADIARARDLFTRLVAREAAFDPTTKAELYADSAVFDFSLQYTDGTVAPVAMTIDDVRKAAVQSMDIARREGITETFSNPVYTPLGQGRVQVDCRITFSDGGPASTMSQIMGPDPASGRFLVLVEKVRMVEMPEAPSPIPGNNAGPANADAPAGPAT